MAECRQKAQVEMVANRPVNWVAAGVIIALWVLTAAGIGLWFWSVWK